MENADFRQQLRRLGVGRGPKEIRTRSRRKGTPIEALLPGEVVDTEDGPFFLYRETYDLAYRHGHHALGDLLNHPAELHAKLARDEQFTSIDIRRAAFIDTETTGLAGGTGTYAFLVGVGVFEADAFTIHQFFMRDYDEEPAQLLALGKLLDGLDAVVSFNGKSFDMPLLETRFIMCRQPPRLNDSPHLDLLPASRRLWKYRLESCALGSLEAEILGVERTQADVPGWMIPGLYADYVRTGDAREMPGISYHNVQDILSMVTLVTQQGVLLRTPLPPEADVPGEDLYGLGRLFQDLGQLDRAESAFVHAALACQSPLVRQWAMRDLAFALKRQERREDALPWWMALAEKEGAVYACEELAKYYEWYAEDLDQAQSWTERGIALVESWSPGPKKDQALADLEHRLGRLRRKASAD